MNRLTKVWGRADYTDSFHHHRRRRCLFFSVFSVLLLTGLVQAKYSGGTGVPEDPYLIADANDLNEIGLHDEDWTAHFLMVNDVNLADLNGTQFNIICGSPYEGWYTIFEGVFDGNDHVISNLNLDVDRSMAGLFGYVAGGVVKNVCLERLDIKATHYAGGIAGRNEGDIRNCSVSGNIEGQQACGGIAGSSSGFLAPHISKRTIIQNCSFRGGVIGEGPVGGVAGSTYESEIVGCSAIAEIFGEAKCGGIVGHNTGGNLQMCFSKGSVTCSGRAGGLVGITYDHCALGGDISDCYADVTVNCSSYAGGFSGSWPGTDGRISDCYCSGKVVYDANNYRDVGGFIGEDRLPKGVFNSYFLETAGPANGFAEPLSEEQMRQPQAFVGWDFVETWNIGENQTYPYLRVYPAGDLNHDGRVNSPDFAIFADHWLADRK